MHNLFSNIKHLRRSQRLTQQQLADILGIKRPSIGSYEEGRSEPRLSTILKICDLFKVSIDQLINEDLSVRSKKQSKLIELTNKKKL